MPRVCKITGKKTVSGHKVSKSNIKTKRRFRPNLHYRKLWVDSEKRWVKLRLTQKALRTIDKKGIDAVLAELRASGVKV